MLFDTSDVLGVTSLIVAFATWRQGQDKRHNREISDLLEDVYFSSDGVISLVKFYAAGQEPTQEQKETVLTEFSDWDTHSSALQNLLDADTHFRSKLGLEHRRALEALGWNKVQVRDAVRELIGDGYQDLNPKDAQEVLKNIYALNKSIEKAQSILCD